MPLTGRRFWQPRGHCPARTITGTPPDGAPDYPMQMMVAVFDFPDKAASGPPGHVPELAVDWIHGRPSG